MKINIKSLISNNKEIWYGIFMIIFLISIFVIPTLLFKYSLPSQYEQLEAEIQIEIAKETSSKEIIKMMEKRNFPKIKILELIKKYNLDGQTK